MVILCRGGGGDGGGVCVLCNVRLQRLEIAHLMKGARTGRVLASPDLVSEERQRGCFPCLRLLVTVPTKGRWQWTSQDMVWVWGGCACVCLCVLTS